MEDAKPEKKAPMTAAERKRRQRARARGEGLIAMELELSYDLKGKLEWAAKKQGISLKAYIAEFLDKSHKNMV